MYDWNSTKVLYLSQILHLTLSHKCKIVIDIKFCIIFINLRVTINDCLAKNEKNLSMFDYSPVIYVTNDWKNVFNLIIFELSPKVDDDYKIKCII